MAVDEEVWKTAIFSPNKTVGEKSVSMSEMGSKFNIKKRQSAAGGGGGPIKVAIYPYQTVD
jgi:hypothetical protein